MAIPRPEFTEPQQRYLLWALLDARHQLSTAVPTRTREILQGKGLVTEDWHHSEEQRAAFQAEQRENIRAAAELLTTNPDAWREAMEKLSYVSRLQWQIVARRWRLTEEGLAVARALHTGFVQEEHRP
jgi:hypothetical protein